MGKTFVSLIAPLERKYLTKEIKIEEPKAVVEPDVSIQKKIPIKRKSNKAFYVPNLLLTPEVFYFHLKVVIRCCRSFFRKSFTIESESALGVASKYNAPRRKFSVESVKKNWLAVAVLPARLK